MVLKERYHSQIASLGQDTEEPVKAYQDHNYIM